MFETVRDASLTDAFRGLSIVFLLLILSVAAVYLGQELKRFHSRGMARLRAYDEANRPVAVEPSNVIVFPTRQRRAG